jgi:hypothetical protein
MVGTKKPRVFKLQESNPIEESKSTALWLHEGIKMFQFYNPPN